MRTQVKMAQSSLFRALEGNQKLGTIHSGKQLNPGINSELPFLNGKFKSHFKFALFPSASFQLRNSLED